MTQEPLAITVSILALIVAAGFNWTAQIDRRSAARLSREKDLHEWATRIANIYVDLLSDDTAKRNIARSGLTIFIAYGRLLFPNEQSDNASRRNSKGRRSSVLDPLVETSHRCQQDDWDTAKILADWRQFTDELTLRTTAFAIDTSPEAAGKVQYRNR